MQLLDICVSYSFNFLRKLHVVFDSDWTNLHSHQQCIKLPFTPYAHQYLCLIFLLIAILIGIRLIFHCAFYLHVSVDLWCWAFLMYLLAICISSLEKFSSVPLPIFKSDFFFGYWVVLIPYIFWMINPYPVYDL